MLAQDQLLISRIVFGAGCALGTIVFPSALWNIAAFPLESSAVHAIIEIVAAASMFAACLLAFWHRRIASYWLLIAACLELFSIVHSKPHELIDFVRGIGFIDLVIAVFGIISDYSGWKPLKSTSAVSGNE